MDALAVVLLRRTAKVAVSAAGPATTDGAAWARALEADLAERGWLLHHELRSAAARLPHPLRVQWADWLLATVEEMVGADRTMIPQYRSFPDTPRDTDAVFVRRLLTHLLAVPGAPCVLCGRDEGGEPLEPCGHPVCRACFSPEQFSACPICGRRPAAGTPYLPMVAPSGRPPAGPPIQVRLLRLEPDPVGAATALRDELVARTAALGEADRDDLAVLVKATAGARLDWLPETVPARETLALVLAWALHASALTEAYPAVLAQVRRRWETATDAGRTLWAYSGGDPGLILPVRADAPSAPGEAWRPVDEPATPVPVTRVRALPRALRRVVLAHLDACGAGAAAEDLRRHAAVWKRLGERLHPYERVAAHPGAAVAFAALRETRTARDSALGAAIVAACAADPRRLILTGHDDGTVTVRVRSHAALVEQAFAEGDAGRAARLLSERPGDLWRRVDQLLRACGPDGHGALTDVLRDSAGRVSPGVLAAAAAELNGRDETVAATPEQLAAVAAARAAGVVRARGAAYSTATTAVPAAASAEAMGNNLGRALRAALGAVTGRSAADGGRRPDAGAARRPGDVAPEAEGTPGDGAAGVVGGRPGPGMPRRVFFPRGSTVTTWTEPERREPLPAAAIAAVRTVVDDELARRAARLDRFDVAVIDAALAGVPAPMRERAASAQFAGWPRGSVRPLPDGAVLRLFLHWQDTDDAARVDLDLSCAFFDADWQQVGLCDYTELRFAVDAAVHSGDLTSAPAPLGATEFLDLELTRLAQEGVRYAVPVVLSYNAVPFELLTEAFAGLMRPLAGGAQFDAARVEQRFDLRGDARVLMPMVLDLTDRRLLWTDLTLPGHGYGHSVGRHGGQLARAAADQWEHFAGGNRATLLDLMAWQAAGRADRVIVVHADGTCTEVAPTVAAVRAAAAVGTGAPAEADAVEGRTVLAATTDGAALDRLVPVRVAAGSVALTVTGRPGEPWTQLHAPDVMGQLAAPG
ncbi:MXAN_6230/SCO0854 family RING domain-containing protein [Actinoplanes sp. NPDC004185]